MPANWPNAPAWARVLVDVVLTALLGFALELTTVAIFAWTLIAGSWELQWGSAWLAPFAFGMLALTAALWLPLVRSLLRPHRYSAHVVAGWFALYGALVVYGLSSGRHFDLWWRRAGVLGIGALGLGWAGWVLTPHFLHYKQARPRFLLGAGALLLLLVEGLNRWLLVRLYPEFHAALAFGAVGLLSLCVGLVNSRAVAASPSVESGAKAAGAAPPRVSLGAWLVCLLALLLAPLATLPALKRLARFDNFRLVLLEQAPVLGQVVRLSSWVVPPESLEASDDGLELVHAAADAGRKGPSLAGRDVLLVTLDALRADHVGAYGYGRPTTPAIDALAKSGARFEWAYASTPHTSYSVTSLMTGKYMRPLLQQGAGLDSETLAEVLRSYGYRTAAFYPPAVFFIDQARFDHFEQGQLGFEYQKKEFLEGEGRVAQVREYLAAQPSDQRVLIWVHLFGPHEPYLAQPDFDFGPRDIDRYDGEIAAADATLGQIVSDFRARRPNGVVVVSADHGEEFGEHGGRYHGSSVYEEQVRVPLVISAPGAIGQRVVDVPVQGIDVMPTLLRALDIPVRPRVRGRDLGPLLLDAPPLDTADGEAPKKSNEGFAYAETEEQSLLASGALRLVCERKLGACRLFDLKTDPAQKIDLSSKRPSDVERLRKRLQGLNATHGQFERQGLRAEGQGWPAAIQRGLTGDGDAALEIAELLDDADVSVRKKAAETLFRLRRPETAAGLRLALLRDEDPEVQRFAALGLTRLGQGASLAIELLSDPEQRWRRWAALAFAEAGDGRGRHELVAWWMSGQRSYEESRELLAAFEKLKTDDAVWPLITSLGDVRLRPFIAQTLAKIGDDTARGPLAKALGDEPYQTARVALAQALLALDAETELVMPMRRWLGVPDPLEGGLALVTQAGILEHVGGPDSKDLKRLLQNAELGELVRLIVPKTGNGTGLRLLVRAKNTAPEPRKVWVGLSRGVFSYDSEGKLKRSRKIPEIHPEQRVGVVFPPGDASAPASERHVLVPETLGLQPGHASFVVVVAEHGLELQSLAVLPLQDEVAPPKPQGLTNPAP